MLQKISGVVNLSLASSREAVLFCVPCQMESDEKVKRFRLHVVKEIYETEKDYTESLEFTVEVRCIIIITLGTKIHTRVLHAANIGFQTFYYI